MHESPLITTDPPTSNRVHPNFGDADDTIHDDAWAKPKPRTNRRLSIFAATLAITLFGIGTFTAGAKMANKSTSNNAGRRAGGLGGLSGITGGALPAGLGGGTGFPGGGFGGGRANRNATSGSGATTAGADALAALLADGTGTAGPAIQGKVTGVGAAQFTVTKQDGTTATITLDNKATFARRTTIIAAAIAVGDTIEAEGTVDTAGNVAATTVTVGDLSIVPTPDISSGPTPATGDDLGGLLGQ